MSAQDEGVAPPESVAGDPPVEATPAEPPVAESDDAGKATASGVGPAALFTFNLGKIEGEGEDSDPILRAGPDLGLVAVFDGMGGAGGTVYETPDGSRTGAYLASRLARDVVERRMIELLDPVWDLDAAAVVTDLQDAVKSALVECLEELKAPPSGLRSKLLRALPTTMALVALQRTEPDGSSWACHILWAGDSRAYVIDPDGGAHQLTLDDIRDEGDAMANLREDSVVSNALSADTDFVIHHRKVELEAPFLLVAATDGCFGYLPSPMHFEELVVGTMSAAKDVDEWSATVQARTAAVTGDDAAMAVLGVGGRFEALQRLFRPRATELSTTFTKPMDTLRDDVARAEAELTDLRRRQDEQAAELWQSYKPGYEQHLEAQRVGTES